MAAMSATPASINMEPAAHPNVSASSGRIQKTAIAARTAPLNGINFRETSGRPENHTPATAPAKAASEQRLRIARIPGTRVVPFHGNSRPVSPVRTRPLLRLP